MPLTADEILRRSAEVYANCSSYRDEGTVTTVFIHGPRPFERRTRRQPFRTLFNRPAMWLFEHWQEEVGPREEWRRSVIWAEGDHHRAWRSSQPAEVENADIQLLFAGQTGVSGGAAFTVPSLLDSVIGGTRPPLLLDPSLEGEEIIHGSACYRITGRRYRQVGHIIWIQQDTLLIRRMFERTAFDAAQRDVMAESMRRYNQQRLASGQLPLEEDRPSFSDQRDFTTETTTDYHPQINTPIDPAEFHFTPPV